MKQEDRGVVRNGQQQEEQPEAQDEGEQHFHDPVARPKIPKNKLPSVFNPTRKKKEQRPVEEPQEQQNENRRLSTDKPERKQPDNSRKPAEERRSKKSMNPLIPARNQIKLFDKLDGEIMEARQDFQRFVCKNIDKMNAQSPPQTRLDQSVTLAVVEEQTSRGGLLKKVLNVPTFKLLYLEEVPISGKDSPTSVKEKLQQWDAVASTTNSFHLLRSKGMAWNYPEGSMSLLYDYVDTLPLTRVLEQLGYLPEAAMKEVFSDCVNCIVLLEKQGVGCSAFSWRDVQLSASTGRVYLRPQLDLNSQIKSQKGQLLNELLAQQSLKSDREKTVVYRLGFLLLYMILGPFLFEEELNEAIRTICRSSIQKSAGRKSDGKSPNPNCCLMHLLDTLAGPNNSIPEITLDLPLYRSARRRISESLQDLICGCLRQNQSQRPKLEDLAVHRFMMQNEQYKFELHEMLPLARVDRLRDIDKKQSEATLQALLQSMDVVLSNNQNLELLPTFREDHRTIVELADELAMEPAVVSRKLNQLYGAYRH